MDQITFTRPDDWHLHLRDGAAMAAVAPLSAQQFQRAVIMPNLRPPVTSSELASAYRQRILDALPADSDFQPLMTLYLTDNTSVADVRTAKDSGHVHAVKLYPAGATTNSDAGVTDLTKVDDTLAAMAEIGLPLLVHGEMTRADIDVFDREKAFIDNQLIPLIERHPQLRVVFEHITTADAAAFVRDSSDNVAATITPQHLLYNRNAMLVGGMHPHFYCLPVLKREDHREALITAAISGSAKFFLGTDSAPHTRNAKESACGCAGIFSGHAAIELYATAFEQADALDKLEGFASHFGADFYGLPRNDTQVTLIKQDWLVPDTLPFADADGSAPLVPFLAGETIGWKLVK